MSRLSIPTSGGERPNRRDCASLSPCARIGSRDNGFNALGLGVFPTTPGAEMAAFDALPPLVQARLREAPVKVATGPLLAFWTSDRGTARQRHEALLDALDRKLGRTGVAA